MLYKIKLVPNSSCRITGALSKRASQRVCAFGNRDSAGVDSAPVLNAHPSCDEMDSGRYAQMSARVCVMCAPEAHV